MREKEKLAHSLDEDADLKVTKLMLQVESCKSRTPATPRDTTARGKRFAEEMLLSEQVEKLNFVLEREKKKLRVGIRVERRASAPIVSSN